MTEFSLNETEEEFSFINGKSSHAFIKLNDCHHIFEVTALDSYIKAAVNYPIGEPVEIKKLNCPKCENIDKRISPIFTSRRYSSFINKQASELENIKQHLRSFSEDENRQQQIQNAFFDLIMDLRNISFTDPIHLSTFLDALNIDPSKVTPTRFLATENCKRIVSTLVSYASEADTADFPSLTKGSIIVLEEYHVKDCHQFLKKKFNEIFHRCACIPISNGLFEQLLSETNRFGFYVDIFLFMVHFSNYFDKEEEIDRETLKSIIKSLTSTEKFDDEHAAWELFETLKKRHDVEYQSLKKENIVLEKVPQKNKWYKVGEKYFCI